jgi:hypothetical protein
MSSSATILLDVKTAPNPPPVHHMPKCKLSRSVAVPYKDVWGTPSGCPDQLFNLDAK